MFRIISADTYKRLTKATQDLDEERLQYREENERNQNTIQELLRRLLNAQSESLAFTRLLPRLLTQQPRPEKTTLLTGEFPLTGKFRNGVADHFVLHVESDPLARYVAKKVYWWGDQAEELFLTSLYSGTNCIHPVGRPGLIHRGVFMDEVLESEPSPRGTRFSVELAAKKPISYAHIGVLLVCRQVD